MIHTLIRRTNSFREIVFSQKTRYNNIWQNASLDDIKNILIVLSSPRSGSSLLFEVLRRVPNLYSLPGETVPYYKLSGLSLDYFSSENTPDHFLDLGKCRNMISRDIINDLEIASVENNIIEDSLALEQYVDDIILRLVIQWPNIHFTHVSLKDIIYKSLSCYMETTKHFNVRRFYLELLKSLNAVYPEINPYYYDLSFSELNTVFKHDNIPFGPPNDQFLIEEPPFIMISPKKKVTKVDLKDKVLILKSSVDCYKMNLIESLFPNAKLNILYLKRNPAAAINGLYDGWLNRGFFSRNLRILFNESYQDSIECLKIKGYSDRYEWAKWWWKYDLPEGWVNHIEDNLEKVCAFQWQSSNVTIQNYLRQRNFCEVCFEDIFNEKTRVQTFERILAFLNIDPKIVKLLGLRDLPVVQSTEYPLVHRWHKRKELILPLLEEPALQEIAFDLGYDTNHLGDWL